MNGCLYDLMMTPFERNALRAARKELLSSLDGTILEIGSGTGANFPYFSEPTDVTACEPDEDMRRVSLPFVPKGLTLESWSAECLELETGSVDHVVCTLVLCSVDHHSAVLAEIRRVLKPEGVFHFIEHIRGEGLVGRLHDLVTPLWRMIAGGCRLNRHTVEQLSEAGFTISEEKEVLRFIGTPFVWGRARP